MVEDNALKSFGVKTIEETISLKCHVLVLKKLLQQGEQFIKSHFNRTPNPSNVAVPKVYQCEFLLLLTHIVSTVRYTLNYLTCRKEDAS